MGILKPLPRDQYKSHLQELGDDCAFCSMSEDLTIKEYSSWVFVFAAFPYRKYHTLLISKRHVIRFTDLQTDELTELAGITQEITELYRKSEIVDRESVFGDQLFFSWRSRDEVETEKKSVSHFHLHIYPEFGRGISIVLEEDAWDIDTARLKLEN